MKHGQHLKTISFKTPPFKEAYKAFPPASPNSTVYLLLPHTEADPKLYNKSTSGFICPAFSPDSNCTYIVLEGQCLGEYLLAKRKCIMTED